MADYIPPSVIDIQDRFKFLRTAEEYYLNFLLEEALNVVDDSWLQPDYRTAIMYLVAHWASLEGNGAGAGAASSGVIQSESFGPMSRTFAVSKAQTMSDSVLSSTEYGRRYIELRKGSFPGIAVV